MDDAINANGLRLAAHVAHPPAGGAAPCVVLCHGFPQGPRGAVSSASTYPELADRIARAIGWKAIAFNLRGTGSSEGDFSPAGWLADIGAVVAHEFGDSRVLGVWLAGVAEGGTFAVCAAGRDHRVRGVATLATPASMREWGRDPTRLVDYARRVGMIRTAGFPQSAAAWGREAVAIDAEAAARRLGARALLVLHGSEDAVVPVDDARRLAAAAGSTGELHVIAGAGHELRHDPRATAGLIGWLERQR